MYQYTLIFRTTDVNVIGLTNYMRGPEALSTSEESAWLKVDDDMTCRECGDRPSSSRAFSLPRPLAKHVDETIAGRTVRATVHSLDSTPSAQRVSLVDMM